MAQILTGNVCRASIGPESGHELAGGHPALVVGNQQIIDATNTAIIIPLTSTSPHYPVFWSVPIVNTGSWASIRHLRTLPVRRLRRTLARATMEDLREIKTALYRELIDEPPEPAPEISQRKPAAEPGTVWTAEVANQSGQDFQTRVLILTSNAQNGMATVLQVDQQARHLVPSISIDIGEPPDTGHIVTYQVRSISVSDRLGSYCGAVSADLLLEAKLKLIEHIG